MQWPRALLNTEYYHLESDTFQPAKTQTILLDEGQNERQKQKKIRNIKQYTINNFRRSY